MKLTFDLSDFWRQVRRISEAVEEVEISLGRDFDPIDEILDKGKEIELSELVPINGLLSYEGRQVLLFIPDHGRNVLQARDNPEKGRRFHVADCITLEEMRSKGRFERYIATNSLTGLFSIYGYDQYQGKDVSFDAELKVCINCLKRVNYKNYRYARNARNQIWHPFSIPDFFNAYSTSFKHLPRDLGERKPGKGYTEDWEQVSAEVRHQAKYCCDECLVDLSDHKHVLHVHHVNGVKHDNRLSNLRALCADCHRKQPMHGHMFVSSSVMSIISVFDVSKDRLSVTGTTLNGWPIYQFMAQLVMQGRWVGRHLRLGTKR